ncbi:phosphonate ABC transporter ATP-binding protein [Leptolyngbya sp. FACHB-711]|jgi:phosphonate transport system ATP-binding protein|uniref:phosphonate ABC transporter ATP-binding protein n=1 Tax=unclassified Leptolyngbya TaxID=2650499 RepID=UPI0016858A4D|nr:phosphonate ABC transporter ATP-binding protein [Leptolyngbya sp. FACHB-711]MBD1852699.1 phosphonate ABC transporter ATP-binding protein [Cyanobacteria bacterium FACHB-502]MBD2023736.1 phosphonate ABC transporter ATP-binding protein [Leptolyngbya sp. FACHB-711]
MVLQNSLEVTAVEVKHLTKSFNKIAALRNINFSVADGEMIALVGASGSGKSTLLRNLNGLHKADQGTVEIYGTPIQVNGSLHSNVRKLRSQMGFIFQQFNLVNRLTVLENVLVGNLSRIPSLRSTLRWFTQQEKEQALAALERVGILQHAYKRASALSGGQQQRVAIARCLMQGAHIILADEPIASLDPESARKVMELLTVLNQEQGITVITSLHQVQMVRHYFKRAVALRDGEVRFDGEVAVLDDFKLNEIYGTATEELVLKGHAEAFTS